MSLLQLETAMAHPIWRMIMNRVIAIVIVAVAVECSADILL